MITKHLSLDEVEENMAQSVPDNVNFLISFIPTDKNR